MSDELELTPFRLLIDRVPDAARAHVRRLFWPVAGPLMAVGLLMVVLQSSLMGRLMMNPESLGEAGFFFCATFLFVALFIAVYGVAFSAMTVAATDAVYGHPVDMARGWRFPFRPSVLATLILVAIANFVATVMCILPVLYVAPVLTFVLPVMIVEGRTGFDAIRRSVELAHYNPTGRWIDAVFLRLLALFLVCLVVYYALAATVQMPFAVVQQILFFREAAAGTQLNPAEMMSGLMWLQVPTQILTAMATAAAWIYWSFATAMVYREVCKGKEAEDLQQAIGELTGEVAAEAGA